MLTTNTILSPGSPNVVGTIFLIVVFLEIVAKVVAIDVLFVMFCTFIVEDVNNMGISKGVSVFVVVDAVKVDTSR